MAFFRRRNNKNFAGLFILLIIVVAGGFFFFKNIKKASAEWFDQNWFYREAVNISNAGSNQTDYQVAITLNTQSLISAGKLQANCNDIRVTDANGKLLPYWIETGTNACNTTTTAIWTKVPFISTSGQTLYVYYGNPNAANAQNGNNVFLFFDDFSGSLNKWTNPAGCAATITSGYMSIPVSTTCDATPIYATGINYSDATGYILEFRGRYTSGGSDRLQTYQRIRNGNGYIARFWIAGTSVTNAQEYTGSWGSNTNVGANGMSSNTWYDVRTKVLGSNNTFYVNGTSIGSITSTASLTPFTDFTFGLGEYQTAVQYDDVRVRKTASTEPTNSNASEEKGPGPVAYWKFDEGQGTTAYDSSSNKNNGTLSGTTKPTWQTGDMCASGKCLYFDGNTSYIDAGNASSLNFTTGSFTIETWVRVPPSETDGVILSKGGAGDTDKGYWLYVMNTGGFEAGITDGSSPRRLAQDSRRINDNNWHHIVAAYNRGGNLTLYIDGVAGATADISAETGDISNSYTFQIGRLSLSQGQYLNGYIDDVKIYPYVRTAAQIKADYNSLGSLSGTSAQVGGQSSWMTNGLVGYWKMDESSWTVDCSTASVIDSSGNGNNGKACPNSTGPAGGATGKFGNGGGFDGSNDYVNLGNSSSFVLGSFTIGVWIKTSASNGDIISSYNGGLSNNSYSLYISSGWPTIYWRDTSGNQVLLAEYTQAVNDGKWHHLVGVRNAKNQAQLYVDGQLLSTANDITTDNTIAPENGYVYFGNAVNLSHTYFNGSVDDVRIYNRALSPKEVSDLYNWAPGPVGWWKFDEGTGTTVSDVSGNGYSGTLVNGPNWTQGKYGKGLQFSESGINPPNTYVNIPNFFTNYPQTSSGAFTQSFWINLTGFPSDHDAQGNDYIRFMDSTWTGGLDIRVANGISGASYDVTVTNPNTYSWSISTGTILQTNTWNFVSVVYDNQKVYIYINDVLKASKTSGATLASQNSTTFTPFTGLTCCNSNYQPWPTYYGDDLRYYNYARTQKQIAEDMNAGHPSVGSPVGSYAAWWKLDEGYGNTIYDQSVNANTGTNHGANWTNDGKFGKALSFDGSSSYVSFPNNIITSTEFTISAWAKMNGPAGASGDNIIFQQRDDTMSQAAVELEADYEGMGSLFSVYSSTGPSIENVFTPRPAYGGWHHYVGVVTSSTISLYIDGVLKNSMANFQTGDYVTSIDYRDLGRARYGGSNFGFFNGVIDEVKVYNLALTADDIKTEYNRGAIRMGSVSDTSGLTSGSIASNSASAAYCIPGDTSTCNPPVGEWKFEEKVSGNNQTVYDTSGNGNNGTTYWGANTSGMNCKVLGKYGTGCQFDGVDDYIDVGNGTSLMNQNLTIEYWANMNASETGYQGTVGTTGYYSNLGCEIYTNSLPDMNFICGNGSVTQYVSGIFTSTAGWHHYVVTKSGSTMNAYKDGVVTKTDSGTLTNSINYTGVSWKIGESISNTFNFGGSIDDVRIFNYARTPAQVAWDYNRGGPVGWWKFDECQGTTAGDASGNGNTGTISIGATGSQTTPGTCTTPIDGTGAWYNGRIGKYNSAMSFDGTDDYVDVGNSITSSSLSGLTINAWINRTAAASGGQDHVVSNWIDSYHFILNGGKLEFDLFNASNTQSPALQGTTVVQNGTWYFLTATYDGATMKVYVNGKLENSTGFSGNVRSGGTTTKIGAGGAYPGSWSTYLFNGLIDDVKIYNYALTPLQIKLDYNQGSAARFGPTTGRP